MIEDDELLRRLRSADPAARLVPNEHRMIAALSAASTAKRRSSSRIRIWIAVALAGALAIGAVSPAVAEGVHRYLAETGWFGSPNPPAVGAPASEAKSTESDDSEWIDTGRSDFVAYAASIFPVYISLPPGYDRDTYGASVAQAIRPPVRGFMQTTGIIDDFETYSRCAWAKTWMSADAKHDSSAKHAAASVLATSATWPATVATDGGGMVSGFRTQARAAQSGNSAAVQHEYALNCPTQPIGPKQ